ncbi:MAG: peptidylprolyl isomerase [Candidatus Krumholzibacteriota bacterium]|nr:peptidylprolyl isomerase [Candidatus Krumholzibacteriota bacterium]
MKKMFVFCVSVMISLFLLNGCSGEKENADSAGTKGDEAADASEVVAVVNGVDITENELSDKIDEIKKSGQGNNRMQMGGQLRREALANMINYELLVMAAEDEGITVSEEDLSERITEIKTGYQSEEQFLNRLKELGMNEAEFEKRLAMKIKIQKLIDKQTAGIESPPESEVREYYDSNRDIFKQPEQVSASHILIKVNEEDDSETKKKKREKLEGILKDIRNGASFSENASLYSEGPSKSKGGNLGFFSKTDMVQPFSEAAFSMDKGEISDIVETRFGYHIIKVNDKKEAQTVSFEEARENITTYLEGMEKNEVINNYIADLRAEADIEYADSSLVRP